LRARLSLLRLLQLRLELVEALVLGLQQLVELRLVLLEALQTSEELRLRRVLGTCRALHPSREQHEAGDDSENAQQRRASDRGSS
jgi:hypothetical protein